MIDEKQQKWLKYGKSVRGHFEVIDTIGVPHPYCITPKHLEYSDSMYLDIEKAEAKGAVCDICKKINRKTGDRILNFKEHETALLVACYVDPESTKETKEELNAFLLYCKPMCEVDEYAGFAFLKKF